MPRVARAVAAWALAAALLACRAPATEVLVVIDTDAPPDRALAITVAVLAGAPSQPELDAGETRTWRRGPGGDGTVVLPATFAIVPGAQTARDGVVTLVVSAQLGAGSAGEPALAFRRVARFAFTPRQTTAVRIFLPTSCAAPAAGCQSVDGAACTVSVLCEERMRTCGDQGACVDEGVVPQPVGRDASLDVPPQPAPDAAPPACTTGQLRCGPACVDPAMDRANCGACGTRCAGAAGCVASACAGPTLAAGQYHTCALELDGTVKCAGQFWTAVGDRPTPATVPGLDRVAQLVVTRQVTCARISDGTVRCWGLGDHGALGDGTTTTRLVPGAPVTGLSDAVDITVRGEAACAVRRTGGVVCWGTDGSGELGDGAVGGFHATPVEVLGVTDAVEVALGYDRGCARLRDGAVWCWGNLYGTPLPMPRAIAGLSGVAQLALGDGHVCARMTDGTVRCFGTNGSGQLGDGTTVARNPPQPVIGVADAIDLVAGGNDACARVRGGAVWCWGENSAGQLATGDMTDVHTAARIVALEGFAQLALGQGHACGRAGDGAVYCWGTNGSGQLGDGTMTAHPLPAPTGF